MIWFDLKLISNSQNVKDDMPYFSGKIVNNFRNDLSLLLKTTLTWSTCIFVNLNITHVNWSINVRLFQVNRTSNCEPGLRNRLFSYRAHELIRKCLFDGNNMSCKRYMLVNMRFTNFPEGVVSIERGLKKIKRRGLARLYGSPCPDKVVPLCLDGLLRLLWRYRNAR